MSEGVVACYGDSPWAWVKFDATGAIVGSKRVTSVVKNGGLGSYTITMDLALDATERASIATAQTAAREVNCLDTSDTVVDVRAYTAAGVLADCAIDLFVRRTI